MHKPAGNIVEFIVLCVCVAGTNQFGDPSKYGTACRVAFDTHGHNQVSSKSLSQLPSGNCLMRCVIRPGAFMTDLATNSSKMNIPWVIYSGNDDFLVSHLGTESAALFSMTL
jgi:hypothetical protein